MGLIKKSVSDTERKIKYAKYAMRVLKECHMVQDFIEYTKSDNYKYFKERYMEKHKTSEIWYDYDECTEIFGTVNFACYYYTKHIKEPYNSYALLIAYLALFDKEEYYRYVQRYDKGYESNAYIKTFLNGGIYETTNKDIKILKKWIKYKEALHGNQDYII